MNHRKLATIQKITNLEPIENADAIEKATVLGWECVVKKGEFSVGDLCVYIEIDSVVPPLDCFKFLEERKYKVKTIKLRGQVSQGLVMPLSIVYGLSKYLREGEDVTNLIGITKINQLSEEEEEFELASKKKYFMYKYLKRFKWYRTLFMHKDSSGWPSFVTHTDEERIQSFPSLLEREKDTLFSVTEKLDGQSASYFLKKEKGLFKPKYTFGVCSRKVYLKTPNMSSYWRIAKKYRIEHVLKCLIEKHNTIVLQGEIIGARIQKNKYKLNDVDFYAFNLEIDGVRINNDTSKFLIGNRGINFVPIIFDGMHVLPTVNEMVALSNERSVINASVLREGLVWRNCGRNISFKVINPNFLLKYEE